MALSVPLLKSNYELYSNRNRRRPSGGNIKLSAAQSAKLHSGKRHYSMPVISTKPAKSVSDVRGRRSVSGKKGTNVTQTGSLSQLPINAHGTGDGSTKHRVQNATKHIGHHNPQQQHQSPTTPKAVPPAQGTPHSQTEIGHPPSPPLRTSQRRHSAGMLRQQSSIRSSHLSETIIEEDEEPSQSAQPSHHLATCQESDQGALDKYNLDTVQGVDGKCDEANQENQTTIQESQNGMLAPSQNSEESKIAEPVLQADNRLQTLVLSETRQNSVDSRTSSTSGRRVRFGTIEKCDFNAENPSDSIADSEYKQIAFKKDSYAAEHCPRLDVSKLDEKVRKDSVKSEMSEDTVDETFEPINTNARRQPAYRRLFAAAVRPCIGKRNEEQ